jgi:integrase
MRLTETFIKKLKPEPKAKKYADGQGLFLFVTPMGVKSWRFRYRDIAGREQEIVFGTYPAKSLQDARKERFEARQLLENGKDPKQERKAKEVIAEQIALSTFEAVANEWYELKKDKWSERQKKNVKNRLKNHVFPVIGNRPVSEIKAIEVLNLIIRKLEGKGNYETAHKILQYCSAIFRLAVITERANYNPLADLRGALKSYQHKNLPTINIKEVPLFLNRLEAHETAEINKLAIKLQLLTFVRPGELRKAEWGFFDLSQRIWRIPAHIMKKRLEHWVPLSKQALDVLEQIRNITGSDKYLFPTKNKVKHPYMNENVINNIIGHKEMGYKGRLVGHGFRSLASTTLNELGYRGDVIEKQLAHEESNKVRAAYNRAQYWEERIELMQGWADYIDMAVMEHQHKKAA